MSTRAETCSSCEAALQYCLQADSTYYSPFPHCEYAQSMNGISTSGRNGCPICRWLLSDIQSHSHFSSQEWLHNKDKAPIWIKCIWKHPNPREFRSREGHKHPEHYTFEFRVGGRRSLPAMDEVRCFVSIILKPLFRPLPLARTLPSSSTGSRETLQTAQEWLTSCLASHRRCRSSRNTTWRPSRLIHLRETPEGRTAASLHEASRDDFECGISYVALSHRWLAQESPRLQTVNVSQFRSSILLNTLKPAVQDAMAISIGLGVPYIWIDSLCIVQDDVDDRNREFPRMAQIYSNAYCTIAANGSLDSTGGCFFSRDATKITSFAIDLKVSGQEQRFLLNWDDDSTPIRKVLTDRAWCFQERFLSPRTLDFCVDSLHWQCREIEACEAYPNGQALQSVWRDGASAGPLLQDLEAKEPKSVREIWDPIVSEYSRRSLTFEEDRLNAIAGIAAYCEQIYGDECIMGLWRSTLAKALAWEVDEASKERRLFTVAPSWSWGSVTGRINLMLPFSTEEGLVEHVKVLDVLVNNRPALYDSDARREYPIELCGSHVLRLRGLPCKARLSEVGSNDTFSLVPCGDTLLGNDARLNTHLDSLEILPSEVTCLPTLTNMRGQHTGLILVSLSSNTYFRIGCYRGKMRTPIDWTRIEDEIYLY